MPITLPPLPWSKDALQPYVSAETVEVHYEKHHHGYLKKLLELRPELSSWRELDDIVRTGKGPEFNNAAQFWNHTYYWRSLAAPDGGGNKASEALVKQLGDVSVLCKQLHEAADQHFGSGWAWLSLDRAGKPVVEATHDAFNPLHDDRHPLLTIDLWEHAWYLDRKSDRAAYLEAVLGHLVNWHFVETNLTQLKALEGTTKKPVWSPMEGWR